jgi:spore coat polysaccharide biosynthesis protein SpsF
MKITAIIQARMQSKRLPGKSMRLIAGKPLIAHVIERTSLMIGVNTVVIATCPGNDELVSCVREFGAESFVGSESNVLERYILAAREFGGEYIVRVTGDNPFTDVDFGSMAIDTAVMEQADLASVSGLPLGAGVEVIRRAALEKAFAESSTYYHFEHVTPYIKENPAIFKIVRKPVTVENPITDLRLTVDTVEDYSMASSLYDALYAGKPFPVSDVIEYCVAHPEIAAINRKIKQRPMTHSENA